MTRRIAPTADEIEALAEDALAHIPPALLQHVRGVSIQVDEFPDDETLKDLGLEGPFDLLGLYHGVSLDRQSVGDPPRAPDRILLYRRPLLDFWCEGDDDLRDVVRNVLIHEIAHHFGFSDDEIYRIEADG
ncbi:MAG: metallopeptidase family protein [Acetobacterales bacterium]